MSRSLRLRTCLLLTLALTAAPAALASPADDASSPWWSTVTQVWSHIVAATSGDDASNIGPYIDPNGTALTEGDDGDGNIGPYIDPDGLTTPPQDGVNRGPYIDPNGFTASPEVDAGD